MSEKLELGCGNVPRSGAVNHDKFLWADHVDVAHDLNIFPWPWEDESFSEIKAHSVLEHLDDFMGFFNECWRILGPGGTVDILVPRYDHINVAIDPTHKRGYLKESFYFLDPSTIWGQRGVMYTDRKWKMLREDDDGVNVHVTLEVRKGQS